MVIAVDFDGTLAKKTGIDTSSTELGPPVPAMVERVKKWIKEGHETIIFTARIYPVGTLEELTAPKKMTEEGHEKHDLIRDWVKRHVGKTLEVTCIKHHTMDAFYDDLAIQVERDTGKLVQITPTIFDNKVTKVGAGYVEQRGTNYRCGDCTKFIRNTKQCAELLPENRVNSNGYCTLWSYGDPRRDQKPTGAWTKEEVGYGEKADGTLCKKCEYFDGPADGRGACQKVKGLIAAWACCNNQSPKDK